MSAISNLLVRLSMYYWRDDLILQKYFYFALLIVINSHTIKYISINRHFLCPVFISWLLNKSHYLCFSSCRCKLDLFAVRYPHVLHSCFRKVGSWVAICRSNSVLRWNLFVQSPTRHLYPCACSNLACNLCLALFSKWRPQQKWLERPIFFSCMATTCLVRLLRRSVL